MYFISEKTIKVKQSEVQTDMPEKFNYFTHCKKIAHQKQSEVQTDMLEKFNYFMQCVSVRDEGRNHDLVIF